MGSLVRLDCCCWRPHGLTGCLGVLAWAWGAGPGCLDRRMPVPVVVCSLHTPDACMAAMRAARMAWPSVVGCSRRAEWPIAACRPLTNSTAFEWSFRSFTWRQRLVNSCTYASRLPRCTSPNSLRRASSCSWTGPYTSPSDCFSVGQSWMQAPESNTDISQSLALPCR